MFYKIQGADIMKNFVSLFNKDISDEYLFSEMEKLGFIPVKAKEDAQKKITNILFQHKLVINSFAGVSYLIINSNTIQVNEIKTIIL